MNSVMPDSRPAGCSRHAGERRTERDKEREGTEKERKAGEVVKTLNLVPLSLTVSTILDSLQVELYLLFLELFLFGKLKYLRQISNLDKMKYEVFLVFTCEVNTLFGCDYSPNGEQLRVSLISSTVYLSAIRIHEFGSFPLEGRLWKSHKTG